MGHQYQILTLRTLCAIFLLLNSKKKEVGRNAKRRNRERTKLPKKRRLEKPARKQSIRPAKKGDGAPILTTHRRVGGTIWMTAVKSRPVDTLISKNTHGSVPGLALLTPSADDRGHGRYPQYVGIEWREKVNILGPDNGLNRPVHHKHSQL
jgi:hypothetical protein